jgi:hypothetical protein
MDVLPREVGVGWRGDKHAAFTLGWMSLHPNSATCWVRVLWLIALPVCDPPSRTLWNHRDDTASSFISHALLESITPTFQMRETEVQG